MPLFKCFLKIKANKNQNVSRSTNGVNGFLSQNRQSRKVALRIKNISLNSTFFFIFTMKKAYSLTLALGVIVGSLSSCSRTDYAVKSQTPVSMSTAQVAAAPAAEAIAPEVTVGTPAIVAPVAAVAPATAAPAPAVAVVAPSKLAKVNSAQVVAQTVAQPTAKAVKPNLVQRIAMSKVMKQVAKAEARQQNTASTAETAASGTAITVALVGLALLLIGIIVGSGFLTTAGAIVLVVGLVLFILKSL
ncbi:hypothetical protein [Hymenobacter coccineus]|nr:hypothetical protein [Hymenobacter coccineus]